MIMLIAAPFYIGLSLVAGPLVTTFFGPKWLEMIPIVAGLALVDAGDGAADRLLAADQCAGPPGHLSVHRRSGAVIMPVCFFFGIAAGPPDW